MRRASLVGGVAAFALVVAACSGTIPAASTISAETSAYLDVIGEIEGSYDSTFDEIFDILGKTYDTREAIFVAVSEVGLPGAARNALTRAESLSPPDEYAVDHLNWLEFRTDVVGYLGDLDDALEHRDLREMLDVLTNVQQRRGDLLSGMDREVCLALVPWGESLCPAPDDLPGGDYGHAVYEVTRAQTLDTWGLFSLIQDMSPDEILTRMGDVQPGIEAGLLNAGEALRSIEPPTEFAEDHQILLDFYRLQYALARSVTAAAAAGDEGEVRVLTFGESNRNFGRTLSALTEEFKLIVAPWVFDPNTA